MTMPQQGPQILQLLGRQPDGRKATFHQHLQNQLCIAPIIFLLPRRGCANLCWMTDPAFDSQLFQEIYEPLHRSGGFDTHAHWAWKRGIKLPHVVAFVLESHLPYLSRCGVQHRQRLLASVQTTSYNSHLGLLRSEHCRVNTEQLTRAVARPASLWHQSETELIPITLTVALYGVLVWLSLAAVARSASPKGLV